TKRRGWLSPSAPVLAHKRTSTQPKRKATSRRKPNTPPRSPQRRKSSESSRRRESVVKKAPNPPNLPKFLWLPRRNRPQRARNLPRFHRHPSKRLRPPQNRRQRK